MKMIVRSIQTQFPINHVVAITHCAAWAIFYDSVCHHIMSQHINWWNCGTGMVIGEAGLLPLICGGLKMSALVEAWGVTSCSQALQVWYALDMVMLY